MSFGNETKVLVYPNPARDVVNVVLDGNTRTDSEIELYDSWGKLLDKQVVFRNANSKVVFNIRGYRKGVYYVKTNAGNTEHIQKVFIQ